MAPDAMAALARVLRGASIDNHETILEHATAALKEFPDDMLAHRSRVVALLKLDRFDDALAALDASGHDVQDTCKVERAYALYKGGKLEEAASHLARTASKSDVAESTPALAHLAAQVNYRMEKFSDANVTYQLLRRKAAKASPEARDLAINSMAASAQLAWTGHASPDSTTTDSLDTFEAAFNAACLAAACGKLSLSSSLLERATRLCDSSDLSDTEKLAEMLSIVTQQAYVFSIRGMASDASDAYARLGDSVHDGDDESMLLGKVNAALLSLDDSNPYLALRKVEEAMQSRTASSLFSYQEARMKQLLQVTQLRAQKVSGIVSRASSLDGMKTPQLSLVNVAAHVRLAAGGNPLATCQTLLKTRPLDLGLVLVAVQLHVRNKNAASAAAVLDTFFRRLDKATSSEKHNHVRFLPGLVALAVRLYRLSGRREAGRAELARAAAYHAQVKGCPSTSLLREAGLDLVMSRESDDDEVALAALNEVLKFSPGDDLAGAGSVAASSLTGGEVPGGLIQQVPDANGLVSGIDVVSLLSTGVVSGLKPGAGPAKRKAASQAGAVTKKRRRRTAKTVEEGKQPDPERWLPLRDRPSYRPKGKKGKKKASEATQGGIAREETLELVGGAGAVKVEKAPVSSAKKKKKGRK